MVGTQDASADWREVYRQLELDIDRKRLAPGAELPTIKALATSTGLTAHGARRVLERLRAENRALSWQGKGYRVALPRLAFSMRERHPTFAQQIRALGHAPTSELVSARRTGLPASLQGRAKGRAARKVVRTEMVRKVNGMPLAISVDYFLCPRLDGIVDEISNGGSISRALAVHGIHVYRRDRTSFQARMPTAHEALLLEIPRGQPVYHTIGANRSEEGEVFQISTGLWRADCVSYEAD